METVAGMVSIRCFFVTKTKRYPCAQLSEQVRVPHEVNHPKSVVRIVLHTIFGTTEGGLAGHALSSHCQGIL